VMQITSFMIAERGRPVSAGERGGQTGTSAAGRGGQKVTQGDIPPARGPASLVTIRVAHVAGGGERAGRHGGATSH
jgi:hypothetical protein